MILRKTDDGEMLKVRYFPVSVFIFPKSQLSNDQFRRKVHAFFLKVVLTNWIESERMKEKKKKDAKKG